MKTNTKIGEPEVIDLTDSPNKNKDEEEKSSSNKDSGEP